MKTTNQLLKGIITLWMILAAMTGAMAQTDDSPTQQVCPGTEPYLIHPGNANNTLLWSISPGTSGTEWTIESPTTAATNITWANTTTPQTYTVTFREVDPVTRCYDEVTLQVTVNPRPEAPVASDQRECQQNPIQTLTATATVPAGATVVWYDAATAGNIVANPILNTATSITYYAEAQIGTCVSATRTAVTLTIDPAPEAPVASDQRECQQNPIQTLTATATVPAGVNVVWYDAATAGNIVANPILNAATSITYYAEAQIGTCVSATRTPVTLTIDPAPEAPTASNQQDCAQNPVQTLTATATAPAGATVVWYDAATAGNVVANPTLSAPGTVTYYAESQIGTCVSATRTAVTLTIDPAPEAPVASDQRECQQNPLQTLTATATAPAGATVVWYDALTAGNVVINPTWNAVGSITYYAESQIGTCVSATRTPVTLTIDPAPIPTINGLDAMCALTEGNVYNTEAGMVNYVWTVSAGGAITAGGGANDNTVTVTWNTVGPQTISVNYQNVNGCSASTPAVRNITVQPIPATSAIFHN